MRMRIFVLALVLLAPQLQAQSPEETVAWMNNNKVGMLEHPTAAPPFFHPHYSFALPSICIRNSDLGWMCVRWEDINSIRIHPSYPTSVSVRGAVFWADNQP